jgi:membrane-anchored protein YejM (alkaline phosphatase superfamily)
VHAAAFPVTKEKQPFEPYWGSIDYMQLNSSFDPKPFFNSYKNSAHYADKNIQEILDFLKKEGLLDNTIIVISSDHGEEFNDNGQNYWGHNGNFTKYQAKIPLVIRWPGKNPRVFEHRTSSLDIVPTLLPEALGCTNPTTDYSSGRSLWNTSARPFVFVSNYSRNALVEPDKISQIDDRGVLTVTDSQNRKITAKPDSELMREFFSETTRFFK